MNTNPKISLTIELEGSTLITSGESTIVKYKITKRDVNPSKYSKDSKEGNKVVRKGTYEIFKTETVPAKQHINISKYAYDYMISKEAPEWCNYAVWQRMNWKQRLEAHLKRTCEQFNGKSFTYTILDD